MNKFDAVVSSIPDEFLGRSSSIFYSAPPAFEGQRGVRMLILVQV